jgi:hypothetical protein
LTGDVGRDCGDASRALLFVCYQSDFNELSPHPSPRVKTGRAGEIDARAICVQHQFPASVGDFLGIVGVSIGVSSGRYQCARNLGYFFAD